jgi:predicted PhzF superfamily epimerase YddE/YHI9
MKTRPRVPRRPHGGEIEIVQGEDMGMRSRLRVDITPTLGESVRVAGTARPILEF